MNNSITSITNFFNELNKYHESSFVIKCSGSILQENDLLKAFAEDVVSLQNAGINIIIVHGGTSVVDSMIDRFAVKGVSANVHNTDQASVEVVEMILSGHVNKKIVAQINLAGGNAMGISGKDGHFIMAKRAKIARFEPNSSEKVINFGFLGELSLMNPDILLLLEDNELIPVISPITIGEDTRTYRVEADDIAGAVAAILSAQKLIFITDYAGVTDNHGNILPEIDINQAYKLLKDSKKDSGLMTKLRAGVMALEQNTETVHMISGKNPHALMLELFTDEAVGTRIRAEMSAG